VRLDFPSVLIPIQEIFMAAITLEGLRVAILATNGVEEAELTEPRKALEDAGAKTTLLAPQPGKIQAMKHDEKTKQYDVEQTLEQANPEQFDAVLLPGGALNADALRVDKAAQDFVRRMDKSGKPIAVICHGPWLLVSAGLVKGHTMTSYHTIQDDVRNAGGQWVDREVVRNGSWVSSRQPSDIPAFNGEMIGLFAEKNAQARKVA
jgi:protease I